MRNIKLMKGLPYEGIPEIEDISEALPQHKSKHYNIRRSQDIDAIIVHHMASEAPLVNQAKYHVNGKGWPAIGYHICISGNKIYQTNDLLAETYHAAGWNHRAIGIAIHGDLSKRAMTEMERILLYSAILTVKSLYPSITRILGHNEASKEAGKPGTICPATDMHRIRADILTLENKIEYENSPEAFRAKAYEIANNTLYLYNLAQGKDPYGKPANEHQQAWAVKKLNELFPAFKAAGLMK